MIFSLESAYVEMWLYLRRFAVFLLSLGWCCLMTSQSHKRSMERLQSHPGNATSKLIDLHNFEYLMMQPACASHIEALIMVHSAPRNRKRRSLIRHTWGGRVLNGTPIMLIFLVGTVASIELQQGLEFKYWQYDNMVQGSFVDHYHNLSYKHVMAFKWLLRSCAHAQILIKVGDDVFMDTPLLLSRLQFTRRNDAEQVGMHMSEYALNYSRMYMRAANLLFRHTRDLLMCTIREGSAVWRDRSSKWFVSYEEYPNSMFPQFCPGCAIIYSTDVVAHLYTAAQRHKFLWIDDVFVTGVLPLYIYHTFS